MTKAELITLNKLQEVACSKKQTLDYFERAIAHPYQGNRFPMRLNGQNFNVDFDLPADHPAVKMIRNYLVEQSGQAVGKFNAVSVTSLPPEPTENAETETICW